MQRVVTSSRLWRKWFLQVNLGLSVDDDAREVLSARLE